MNENQDTNVVEEQNTEPAVNLDKLNQDKGTKSEPQDELSKIKQDLEKVLAEKERIELQSKKYKEAFDKKAKETAEVTKALREVEKSADAPLEKLSELEQKVQEYEFEKKKTELFTALTEDMPINKEIAKEIVSAFYNDDTKEIVIGDFIAAYRKTLDYVQETAFQKGYETRDIEVASNKPRSYGDNKPESSLDKKLEKYVKNLRR